MTEPDIELIIPIHIEVYSAERSGRSSPIQTGFRPLCVVEGGHDDRVTIGMCELELDRELAPGEASEGRLAFSAAVAEEARALLTAGKAFELAEGERAIARAVVAGPAGADRAT